MVTSYPPIYESRVKYELTHLSNFKRRKRYDTINIMERFFKFHHKKLHPLDYQYWDMDDYISMRRRTKKLSHTSLWVERAIIIAFWRWMVQNDRAPYNPFRPRKYPYKAPNPTPHLEWEEVEQLLTHCPTPQDKLLVHLILATSMGVTELVKLKWSDFEEGEGSLATHYLGPDTLALMNSIERETERIFPRWTDNSVVIARLRYLMISAGVHSKGRGYKTLKATMPYLTSELAKSMVAKLGKEQPLATTSPAPPKLTKLQLWRQKKFST